MLMSAVSVAFEKENNDLFKLFINRNDVMSM